MDRMVRDEQESTQRHMSETIASVPGNIGKRAASFIQSVADKPGNWTMTGLLPKWRIGGGNGYYLEGRVIIEALIQDGVIERRGHKLYPAGYNGEDLTRRCGHPTKRGAPCKTVVSYAGEKCAWHNENTLATREADPDAFRQSAPQARREVLARVVAEEPKYQRDALESINEALAVQAHLNVKPSEVKEQS
jgi:hypothetical protein